MGVVVVLTVFAQYAFWIPDVFPGLPLPHKATLVFIWVAMIYGIFWLYYYFPFCKVWEKSGVFIFIFLVVLIFLGLNTNADASKHINTHTHTHTQT